jgi:hypothetical protein
VTVCLSFDLFLAQNDIFVGVLFLEYQNRSVAWLERLDGSENSG